MEKKYYPVNVNIQFENNTQVNIMADNYDYINNKYIRFAEHFVVPCEGVQRLITSVVNLDHVNMITFNHDEEKAVEW